MQTSTLLLLTKIKPFLFVNDTDFVIYFHPRLFLFQNFKEEKTHIMEENNQSSNNLEDKDANDAGEPGATN